MKKDLLFHLIRFWNKLSQPVAARIFFIAVGISSTVWFLYRVIPKPSRAAYPCMRAAAPFMSAFVLYLISLFATAGAWMKTRSLLRSKRYIYAGLSMVVTIVLFLVLTGQRSERVFARAKALISPVKMMAGKNEPVGTAKGIYPGRVVWTHIPGAATWDGKTGNWFDDQWNPQNKSDKMIESAITSLTGEKKSKKAWDAIFLYFNKTHNKGDRGYLNTEKIAIKINLNNTYSHDNSPEINASPQLTLALLRSLVNTAGIPQKNITVFDASRFVTNYLFDKCHAEFPDVVFVDNTGGDGRTMATYKDEAIPYSADNGKLATGLASCAVDADYLIDFALLKGHIGQGVTLCGKNWYGVTSINKDWRKNAHNNFNQDRNGKNHYMTFTDYMGHKDLGGKTMLFLIDGTYGSKLVNGVPGPKWQMAPFNGEWPCSLLASQDGVAIDAVALDFLSSEFPDLSDIDYADSYLQESAKADNPPSGTHYDPEKDGTGLTSLGVLEHWNNPDKKQYSRNLGKNEGIELIHLEK